MNKCFGIRLPLFCCYLIAANWFAYSNAHDENLEPEERERRCQHGRKFVDDLNTNRIKDGKWKAAFNERFAVMNDTEKKRMHGYVQVALPKMASASTAAPKSSSSSSPSSSSSESSSEEKSESSAAPSKKYGRRRIYGEYVRRRIYGEYGRRKRATTCSYTYAFDARTQWPACAAVMNSIRDQSGCGDCWAVASASVFTDRWCIQREKSSVSTSATAATSFFSEADLMSCTPNSYGCDGGSPYYAFQYIKSSGVVSGTNYTWSSGCKPYPFPPQSSSTYTAPACFAACTNTKWTSAYSADKKYVSSMGWLQASTATVSAIQTELKANGPVVAAMDVYDDFYYYSSGVYKKTSTAVYQGGHAIRLLGWGTQTCTDGTSQSFWLAANSWNTNWGLKGLFLIASGKNECNIENLGIFWGAPKIA